MGHVPSKEFCAEPFAMDVYSRAGPERLVAIALTKYYFPSVDDPLFQKFCQVRNENHVKNWFYRPPGIPLDVLPHAPTDAQLYQYYVEDATAVVDMKLPPKKFIPMPLLIVKMNESSCREYPNVRNCVVMGMYGSRHFEFIDIEEGTGDHKVVRFEYVRGLSQIFMSNVFYNEVKAISCFRLGCACYKYYCRKAGLDAAPWPLGTGYETSATNLPLFKLTQQLNYLVHDLDSWVDDGIVFEESGTRVYCGVEESTLAVGADGLGNSVDYYPEGHKQIALAMAQYAAANPDAASVPPPGAAQAKEGDDTTTTMSDDDNEDGGGESEGEEELSIRTNNDGSKKRKLLQVYHAIRVGQIHGTLPPAPLNRKYGHLEDILERAKPIWKEANKAVLAHQIKKGPRYWSGSRPSSGGSGRHGSSGGGPGGGSFGSNPGSPRTPGSTELSIPTTDNIENKERPFEQQTLEERGISLGNVTCMLSFDAPAMKAASQHTAPASAQERGSPHTAVLFPESNVMPEFRLCGPNPADQVYPVPLEAVPPVDPRVFLGDRTPVTIRTAAEQWVPKFWRNPLQHLTRSSWQPHLEHGFVAYTIDHYTMVVYDQCWYPEVLLGCSPFVFLAEGEAIYKIGGPNGEYVAMRVS